MKTCVIKNCRIGEGKPKICVPIVGRTKKEILAQAEKISEIEDGLVNIVEFRGDYYEQLFNLEELKDLMLELKKILSGLVLLFTIRSEAEGGEHLAFDFPSISDINMFVAKEHLADLIDVELFSGEKQVTDTIKLAHENAVKVIMSNHDFATTPQKTEIKNRLLTMQSLGCDIAKIAVMPKNKKMVLELLEATLETDSEIKVPIVTMSMGKEGAISRVTGQIFGSAITFASLDKASAPGQIPVEKMNALLEDIHTYMS